LVLGYLIEVSASRAVVIGAGHNGLPCAGTLAKAGWEVTVLGGAAVPGGAVHSWEGPAQQLIFRPAAELARYRTRLRGLHVASASTRPGPGVHGTPGAARVAQADASGLRRWQESRRA
jgi:phytoene dehydrogenase-like protein